jgi:hypothetical protein
MRKLYENFHIFHFQKRIVSAETVRGNTIVSQLKPSNIQCKGKKVEGDSQIVIGLMETIMKCFL